MPKIKRRTNKELEAYKKENRTTRFSLLEQPDFKGSKELLETMQDYERLYREGRPAITDEEWDELVRKTNYVESLDEVVSPSGRKYVQMGAPLLSLSKVVSIDDLNKFLDRFKDDQEFIVSPKLDGLTYSAFYKEQNGVYMLDMIGTRGDGTNSLILHEHALTGVDLKYLPKEISGKSLELLKKYDAIVNNRIELRGEAVINKEYYKERYGVDPNTVVMRSIASGIFNRKESENFEYLLLQLEDFSELNAKSLSEAWENMSKESKKLLNKLELVHFKDRPFKRAVKKGKKLFVSTELKNESDESFTELDLSMNYGRLGYERLDFITFSVASKNGSLDIPELIRGIDGVMYVNDIPGTERISKVTSDRQEIIKSVDAFYGTVNGIRDYSVDRLKSMLIYHFDGVVIKPVGSNKNTQETKAKFKNGKYIVPKAPKDQVAVKLQGEKSKTRILKINRKETSLGNVTFSAEIEPTLVEGGAIIRNVNLHNERWLSLPENSWIKEGVECYVSLSMDIIPILSESL